MTDQEIEQYINEQWDDNVIYWETRTVVFRSVSDANFKEFYSASIDNQSEIDAAVKDAHEHAVSAWEQFVGDDHVDCDEEDE